MEVYRALQYVKLAKRGEDVCLGSDGWEDIENTLRWTQWNKEYVFANMEKKKMYYIEEQREYVLEWKRNHKK